MQRATQTLILAKIEPAVNTDATPVPATEAIITSNEPTFEIVNNAKQRNIPLSYFGQVAPVNHGTALKLTFTTEYKGSGTPGTAPKIGALLRACGMTETVSAGTSVVYTPHSNLVGETVTLYFYTSGSLHKLVGCVGTWKMDNKAQDIMQIQFEFTGIYSPFHASDIAFPSPTYSSVAPIKWINANVVYNNISTLICNALSLDFGAQISQRDDAGSSTGIQRYFIKDRQAKGSMTIEREDLTTLDPWVLFDQSTQANIETKPTGTSGNTVEIIAIGVTLEPPKYGNKENIRTWELSYSLNPTLSAGNNEIVLTFK